MCVNTIDDLLFVIVHSSILLPNFKKWTADREEEKNEEEIVGPKMVEKMENMGVGRQESVSEK